MIFVTQQEEERLKDLERLKTLRPMDDDFMRAMFRKNNSLSAKRSRRNALCAECAAFAFNIDTPIT